MHPLGVVPMPTGYMAFMPLKKKLHLPEPAPELLVEKVSDKQVKALGFGSHSLCVDHAVVLITAVRKHRFEVLLVQLQPLC
jgi:hypothetical protein